MGIGSQNADLNLGESLLCDVFKTSFQTVDILVKYTHSLLFFFLFIKS